MELSLRAKSIKPSSTLAITSKAKAMKKRGEDVVLLSAGEPDFDTPQNVKEAAKRAIDEGFTKYTPASGMEELKDAVVESFKKYKGLEYSKENILISCGGKHSLYNIFQAVVGEGDEVIIPSPYWVSYPSMVILAGGKPVTVETKPENGFKLSPEDLERAITGKTKAIILNYPSNPTGAMYTKEDLEAICDVLKKYPNIYVVSDEIYSRLVFDGVEFVSIASIEDMLERTFVVDGVSKTYSMTGWRIGFVAGPKDAIKAMSNIQSQSTSNPTSISQKAAIEALTGPQDEVEKRVSIFQERRDLFVDLLSKIDGIEIFKPMGSFYVFPSLRNILAGKGMKSFEFSERLLDEAKVASVPGVDFGCEYHIRLSFAASEEDLKKGAERIASFVEGL